MTQWTERRRCPTCNGIGGQHVAYNQEGVTVTGTPCSTCNGSGIVTAECKVKAEHEKTHK